MGFLTVLKKMRQKEKEMRILLLWDCRIKFHLFIFFNRRIAVVSIMLARQRFLSDLTASPSTQSHRHWDSISKHWSIRVKVEMSHQRNICTIFLFQATRWTFGMWAVRNRSGHIGGTTSKAQMALCGLWTQLIEWDSMRVVKNSTFFCSKKDLQARLF